MRPSERALAEYLRCYHARDWEGRRQSTRRLRGVDRRRPALWEIDGPDDVVRQLREAWEQQLETHATIETIAVADDVVALRQTFSLSPGEAPAENAVGQVVRFRDGRIAGFDVFEPGRRTGDARPLRRAGGRGRTHDGASGGPLEWNRHFNARDWAALRSLYADDATMADRRRPALWEIGDARRARPPGERGPRADGRAADLERDATPPPTTSSPAAACSSSRPTTRRTRSGRSCSSATASSCTRRSSRPTTEAGILARFEELRADDGATVLAPGIDPRHPTVVMWRDLMRAINRRDWDTARTFFVEDYRAVDHKPIGWEPIEGPGRHRPAAAQLVQRGRGRAPDVGDHRRRGRALRAGDDHDRPRPPRRARSSTSSWPSRWSATA